MCEKCKAYNRLIEEFGNDKKAVNVYKKELNEVHKNESRN